MNALLGRVPTSAYRPRVATKARAKAKAKASTSRKRAAPSPGRLQRPANADVQALVDAQKPEWLALAVEVDRERTDLIDSIKVLTNTVQSSATDARARDNLSVRLERLCDRLRRMDSEIRRAQRDTSDDRGITMRALRRLTNLLHFEEVERAEEAVLRWLEDRDDVARRREAASWLMNLRGPGPFNPVAEAAAIEAELPSRAASARKEEDSSKHKRVAKRMVRMRLEETDQVWDVNTPLEIVRDE